MESESKRKDSKGKNSTNGRQEIEARLIRQSLLAKPYPRRLLPYPDPNVYFINGKPIPQSCLVYKASKRIKLLSKFIPRQFTPKYVKPEPPKHLVNPEALIFVATSRILELAIPTSKLKKEAPKKPKKKDLKKLKRIRRFIQNRPAWLELRAAPRKIPPPALPEKVKPAHPISPEEQDERFRMLAEPKHIFYLPEETPGISKAALTYVPTKRVLEISAPKELNPETILNITYNPFKIKRAALNYRPSERMIQLAAPNIRKKLEDTDVKENPFSVIPRALKAICTKRVKELAKPIERD